MCYMQSFHPRLLRFFIFSSRRRHTSFSRDWSSDVCSSDLHAGKHIGVLCQEIHRQDGETGVKRILGVRLLIRTYGVLTVEDACGAALELGAPTYRFVKHYLDRRAQQPQVALRQIDPLIRELTHYRDHINQLTKEPPDEPR